MLKMKASRRKTPWDDPARTAYDRSALAARNDCVAAVEESEQGVICLRGVWVFDPHACTSQDTRHFFWAGLQLLSAQAQQMGLTERQVRQLMMSSFNAFHDAANGLWDVLQRMTAEGGVTIPLAAVEAHCQISGAITARTVVPVPTSISEMPPLALAPSSDPVTILSDEVTGPAEAEPPLLQPEGADKNSEAEDYPVAEFYEPAGYGWTPQGYEVRAALKRYSEATHADR